MMVQKPEEQEAQCGTVHVTHIKHCTAIIAIHPATKERPSSQQSEMPPPGHLESMLSLWRSGSASDSSDRVSRRSSVQSGSGSSNIFLPFLVQSCMPYPLESCKPL